MGGPSEGRARLDALARLMFEQAAEGMVISRPADGVILEANDAWCALMGWERREVLGRTALELGLWVDPAERSDTLDSVRRGAAADGSVIAFRRKDGTVRIGEVKARMIEIDGQEHMVAGIRDITERIAVEQELERSRAELAAAQRVASIGSWTWEPATGRTSWSEEMCRIFELDPPGPDDTLEDVMPSLVERIHPQDRAAVQAWVGRSSRTGRVEPLQHRIVRSDGSVRWVLAMTASDLELGETGTSGRFVGTVQDITARVLADEERRRLLSELLAVREEERERIATGLHDDVVQSLTAALLQVDLLAEHGTETGGVARLERIRGTLDEAITRSRRLIIELHPPSLDRISLGAAIHDLALLELGDAGVRIDVDDRQGLQLPAEIRSVVYRIAQEAITNVRRHAAATAVSITLAAEDDLLHVTVRDDGVGIDPALGGRSPQGRAGVSSMHQRAELAGGRLEIGPAAGGGTLVELWLPVHPPSTA